MQSTCLRPLLPPLRTFSGNLSSRKIGFEQRSRPSKFFLAFKRDAYDKNQNGRVVDENMIVLRLRIHEIKMAESNDDRNVPDDWMEWEKRYYHQGYISDISKGIGILQLMLMETRPSLALGMLAFVLFSLLSSMIAVVFMLMNMG